MKVFAFAISLLAITVSARSGRGGRGRGDNGGNNGNMGNGRNNGNMGGNNNNGNMGNGNGNMNNGGNGGNGGNGNMGNGNMGNGGMGNMVTFDFADPAANVTQLVNRMGRMIRLIVRQNRNIAPTLVRLGFHDCLGDAGCNGCVNMALADNRGLEPALRALEPVINETLRGNFGVSRADVVAFAALAGANVSQNEINFLSGFNFGRVNCEDAGDCDASTQDCYRTGPDQPSDHPSPDLTTHALTEFFATNFNLTTDQTVAIMGAHTLGDANRQNSGFNGGNGWVNNELRLDNEYYQQIVGGMAGPTDLNGLANNAPNWRQIEVNNTNNNLFPNRFQWVRGGMGGGMGGGNDGTGMGGGNGGTGMGAANDMGGDDMGDDGDGTGDGGMGGRGGRGGRGNNLRQLQRGMGGGGSRGGGRNNGGRNNGGRNNGGRNNGGRNNGMGGGNNGMGGGNNGMGGGNNGMGGGQLFMLNADIAIVRDMSGGFLAANGDANCTFSFQDPTQRCPLASTLSKAGEYRNNNSLFLSDFFIAFTKVLEKGL